MFYYHGFPIFYLRASSKQNLEKCFTGINSVLWKLLKQKERARAFFHEQWVPLPLHARYPRAEMQSATVELSRVCHIHCDHPTFV